MTTGAPPLPTIRRLLAATFLAGSVGTGAELLLMEHTEGVWQNAPLALLGLGCLTGAALAITTRRAVRQTFRVLMLLFASSGIAGAVLHYDGNVEFERELNPEASGFTLFREAMKGATPALAPGTMILLGAVGWAYYRTTVALLDSTADDAVAIASKNDTNRRGSGAAYDRKFSTQRKPIG